ncbi:ABC transporter permease, partial [Caldalkalibacillus mannanilyticus]|uniref:ABC transporter permease n=1 Tax=Caldalkalibacillus mannanilyticus TaxID=1418 RepID=UPI00190149B3
QANKQKNKKQKTNLSLSDTDLEESREEKQRLDLLNKSIVLNLTKMGSDGQEISKTVRLRVVGILEEEGGQEDQNLYISLKLAEQLVKWKEGDQVLKKKGYDSVKVKVKSVELVEEVQKEIEKLNLNSFSLKQMLATVNNISRVIQFILGGLGVSP